MGNLNTYNYNLNNVSQYTLYFIRKMFVSIYWLRFVKI